MYSSFSRLLFVVIGLLLLLDAVKAPCPAQRRQPTTNTTPAQARRIYTSIRQVDFNNFVFIIPSPIGVTASVKGEQITVRKGIGTGSNPEGGCEYRVEGISYGDLISDEAEDAVIVLGCSLSPGTGYSNAGYIYGLREGQAVLLAEFQGGSRGELILGVVIAYRSLIAIKDDGYSDPPRFQAINYKWNGRKLVEVGRTAMRRVQ